MTTDEKLEIALTLANYRDYSSHEILNIAKQFYDFLSMESSHFRENKNDLLELENRELRDKITQLEHMVNLLKRN